MDNNKYSVDDILEDIKRKKMAKLNNLSNDSGLSSSHLSAEKSSVSTKNFFPQEEIKKPISTVSTIEPEEDVKIYGGTKFKDEIDNDNDFASLRNNEPKSPPRENSDYKIGSSISKLLEEEDNSTSDGKEYFQGNKYGNSDVLKPSRVANAFGEDAYKPYENKNYEKLQEKHKKKFGIFSDNEKEKAPKKAKKENFENADIPLPKKANKQSFVDTPMESKKTNTEPKQKEISSTENPNKFTVNLKNNFFDDNDKENTSMDIHMKNMDSSKAAKGFTRNIVPLEGTSSRRQLAIKEDKISKNLEEYNSKDDYDKISKDLKSFKMSVLIKIALTMIICGVLIYWGISLNNTALPLPSFMLPETNPQIFVAVNLGFTMLAALICSTIVGSGFISLFSLKPDNDTPAALAFLATIINGVTLTIFPENITEKGINMYFALTALTLLFNLFGKLLMINRIIKNFKTINTDEKFTMQLITNKNLAQKLTKGQNLTNPMVAYSCKTDFTTNFLNYSYSEDFCENINKFTTPLFLVFSLILSIVTFVLNKNIFIALTVFNCMMCICSPLTNTLISNLPLKRLANALSKEGAAITGNKSLDDFDDITTITVDANDLFYGGTVILHGIKAFSESRIDEAILDAASVTCKASGILMDIFMQMIGEKENLLKDVDSLIYEDKMGISAWVDGKKVLIGNRSLMTNHGITPPEIAYENKFKKDGREIVYLSNSGELTAMFVITYKGSVEMADYLDLLASKGISLSVYTTDPNITAEKIEEIFEYPKDMVTIMGADIHSEFNEIACDKDKAPAKIIFSGTLDSKIMAICDLISAKSSIVLGTILQMLGIVVGYATIAFFAFTGQTEKLNFELVMAYQVIWALLISLITNIKKY